MAAEFEEGREIVLVSWWWTGRSEFGRGLEPWAGKSRAPWTAQARMAGRAS